MMNWEIPPFIPRNKEITLTRKKFTKEEDEKLKNLVNQYGAKKWDQIAEMMPGRTGRQCRDRYRNYLIPGYFNGEWTQEEDDLLHEKFEHFGPQWARMMQFFPGRSANSLKNRWNYFVCRVNRENEKQTNAPELVLPSAKQTNENSFHSNIKLPQLVSPKTIENNNENHQDEKIIYGVNVATQTNENDFTENGYIFHD